MLRDLIVKYSEVLSNNNEKEIRKVERELARFGMDVATAKILVKEYREGRI